MVVTTFPFLWDELIGQLMLNITGSALLVGLVGIFFIAVLGLAMRLTLEIQLIAMFFYIMTVVVVFVPWLAMVAVIGVGIFIGMFFFYTLFRG